MNLIYKFLGFVSLISLPSFALAQDPTPQTPSDGVGIFDRLKNVTSNVYSQNTTSNTVIEVVGLVINGFFALLGVIFILMILIAGYNWMTAAGDEDKVEKAQTNIRNAIIGLIVTVGVFAIWNFIDAYLIGK